jgi:hypothetical protein
MLLIAEQPLIQEAITYVAEWGVSKMNNCNFTTCRYNENNCCTNSEKRAECVDTSGKALCVDISVDAVNEYAKSILGRYPKDNMEFSRALAMKILEETKSLANSTKKE